VSRIRDHFDLPDLRDIDDSIANGTYRHHPGEPMPLALFSAARVDYSLQRLRHYTGTNPAHFQNYILFTNYQFYVDEFVRRGQEMMAIAGSTEDKTLRQKYEAFVEPGDVVTINANLANARAGDATGLAPQRLPQMPAYHLKRDGFKGITLVNIGVGPSNAKTITDHIAHLAEAGRLRAGAWLCA
jgi:AMP nucleosidase